MTLVRDFADAFTYAGGDWSRVRVYWPEMTAATWPCHE